MDTPKAFASAVRGLLAAPEATRRRAARVRAEAFTWERSVAAFLQAHDALPAAEPRLPEEVRR